MDVSRAGVGARTQFIEIRLSLLGTNASGVRTIVVVSLGSFTKVTSDLILESSNDNHLKTGSSKFEGGDWRGKQNQCGVYIWCHTFPLHTPTGSRGPWTVVKSSRLSHSFGPKREITSHSAHSTTCEMSPRKTHSLKATKVLRNQNLEESVSRFDQNRNSDASRI